jgi:cysteine sulfinate desulfinase/cysteine desulfurase-like protein/rhodanese-related sulfurtransferase
MNMEIYLDANATSPVLPAAIDAVVNAMRSNFGNPSSSHAAGIRARALLDDARARARHVLGAGTGRLMFTSGATEGIQTAVLSALCAVRARREAGQPCGELLLYGATEHKAVPEALAHWNRVLGTGLELQALPVDLDGRHRLDVLRELAPRAAFVCTMAANNETGAISDLAGIEAVLRETGTSALWMVDCVQALGKLPLALAGTRIDYAPFSGHKLYAPKGIGMLYVRDGAPFTPLLCGGGQEAGQRSGTENMTGIAAMGAVLAALEEGDTFRSHDQLCACRERITNALREAFPGIVFNARFEHALPTTINFSVPGLSSKDLLDLFDAAGVRVSAGSACSAAKAAPSYVLDAMGLPAWRSASAVRLSFGPLVDDAFIDEACARIARCGQALRAPVLGHDETGLLQLGFEGRCGWLLFDAGSRACIAIDPPAALAARIAAIVRREGYRMQGVLATGADPEGVAACAALGAELGCADVDWQANGVPLALADGSSAQSLAFGSQVLVRVSSAGRDRSVYLLGAAARGELPAAAVQFAFIGGVRAAGIRPLIGADTVLCSGTEGDAVPCTTYAPAVPDADMHLAPGSLASFLAAHPDAVLVDVREPAEHAAGPASPGGLLARSVPLSRFAGYLPKWLHEPRPLVFFCRSGNRSARAAACLRQMGYTQAWHLSGGLAMA